MRMPVPYQSHRPILEEGGGLLFDPDELRRFFPSGVVEHLIRLAPPTSPATAAHLGELGAGHLKRFPIGPDLPVVVATRMTLSFPVLISAIRLYELDAESHDAPRLVRVWFSDGGITSNFPVHFFDSPLPTHPTFALDLTSFGRHEAPKPDDPCAAVVEPRKVNEPAYQPVAHIEDLQGFFTAIKDAMQNWRDNAQSQLPGFRDRIAHIKLGRGEGGLNLTMSSALISELNKRGECAGEGLANLFAGDGTTPTPQWNDHRFVRYRTTMSVLERLLRDYERGYCAPVDRVTVSYANRIAQGVSPPYAFPGGSPVVAQDVTSAYLGLVAGWTAAGATLDDGGVPRPPSVLRAVPPV